ncbi:MAG: Vacuolar H+transporting two-sector ATPase F subunit [Magnetococcales bacterium]|nr:Vacuolar H+transporting two-sector ATPase F subunit [Magnetococcales bacterium]
MGQPVFIGDTASAAAWRFAGLRVVTPDPGQELTVLAAVRKEAPLVVITAEFAGKLPPKVLEEALVAVSPPLLVVTDVRGLVAVPDLEKLVRTRLGLEQ